MNVKVLVLIGMIFTSVFSVFSFSEDGNFYLVDCQEETNNKNVRFGALGVVPCVDEVEVKTYSKPYMTQPQIREVVSENKREVVVIERSYDSYSVDKSVRFGDNSFCSDDSCEIDFQEYSKPVEAEPRTLVNSMWTFVMDCLTF